MAFAEFTLYYELYKLLATSYRITDSEVEDIRADIIRAKEGFAEHIIAIRTAKIKETDPEDIMDELLLREKLALSVSKQYAEIFEKLVEDLKTLIEKGN